MDVDLPLVKETLRTLNGQASCSEIAAKLHQQFSNRKYSEIDLAVRQIVYSHCPQHLDEYQGEPVFAALDVWRYGFWETPKQYSARYTQVLYRKKLIASWQWCMVTGTQSQCKASHIKPRRCCVDQDERGNVFNGFLLNPTIDELFDKGLISFDDEGQIIFSPTLPQRDIERLGLSSKMRLKVVRSGHRHFLQYHRSHVFRVEPSITATDRLV